ncbi:hypothetical protein ACFC1B_06725 [Streptomyces xiamenensis]|uniref:hypothetical protein n=1 Tax=Streptomyces xiamenensis TaxID=408015 RepID=UPI0035DAF688
MNTFIPCSIVGASSRDAFALLDEEWTLLDQRPDAARIVAGWLIEAGVLEPELRDLSLVELRGVLSERDRRQGCEHSDRWLTVLLLRAREGGEEGRLAARFVVQAMLPSAVRTAQRVAGDISRRDDIAQVVVASLWEAAVTFPVERRAARIATNLALETVHLATRDAKRERPGSEGQEPDEDLVDASTGPAALAEEDWLTRYASRLSRAGSGLGPIDGSRRELLDVLVWAVDSGVVTLASARALVQLVEEQEQAGGLRRPGVQESARLRKARSRAVAQLRAAVSAFLAEAA